MKNHLSPSRLAYRATTDKGAVIGALRNTRFCTISYIDGGKPYSLPTAYCLHEGQLCIHGSVKSHFLEAILDSQEVCINVFQFDGIVLAASAFHHSINYRSVVIFSKPEEICGRDAKLASLKAFTDQMVPGRWSSLRPITEGEITATRVVAFSLERASMKYREGPPSFEKEDVGYPVWTGVLPAERQWQAPIPDPGMEEHREIPEHIQNLWHNDAY